MISETILDLAAAVPTVTTIPSPHPIPYFARIGHLGRTAQWVAFIVFLVSTIALVGLGSRHEKKNRAFHILSSIITGIAALSYYAMATKSGYTWVHQGRKIVQGKEVALIRQVFWARYVDWALTTPLLLLDLGLLAGLPWLDIFTILVLDEAMIITGLIAGFNARSKALWGWFVFSTIFLIFILYTLLWTGRKTARLQANHVAGLYNGLSIFTIILWSAYPVVFALSDGVGIINPDLEAVVYAVLDISAKSVFGFWLVFVHKHDSGGDHAATLPDHWVEPRSHQHGIHLPGGDD